MEYIDIISEIEDGYLIRLTRVYDGYEKTTEETLNRHLFDICLKTGYFSEINSESAAA